MHIGHYLQILQLFSIPIVYIFLEDVIAFTLNLSLTLTFCLISFLITFHNYKKGIAVLTAKEKEC